MAYSKFLFLYGEKKELPTVCSLRKYTEYFKLANTKNFSFIQLGKAGTYSNCLEWENYIQLITKILNKGQEITKHNISNFTLGNMDIFVPV